jgi:hypothetical protein
VSSRVLALAAGLGLLLLGGVGVLLVRDTPPAAEPELLPDLEQPERKERPPRPGPGSDPAGWHEIPGVPAGGAFPRGGSPAKVDESLLTDDGHPKRVLGVVVDDASGEPVRGATVRYLVERGGAPPEGREATTAGDGAFEVRLQLPKGRARKRVSVFVRAPGYEDLRAEAGVDSLELRLRERRAPLRLGRIIGTVRREERPFRGRIMVEARDEFGGFEAQWTVADQAGRFVLVGYRPGRWWFNVHGSGQRSEALIAGAGEAVVDVQVGDSMKAAGDFPLDPRTREVVVAPLPPGVEDGDVVRAKVRDRFFWRQTVADSQATFAALPVGLWEIVVEDGERALARASVLVEPGEGPITVRVEKVE